MSEETQGGGTPDEPSAEATPKGPGEGAPLAGGPPTGGPPPQGPLGPSEQPPVQGQPPQGPQQGPQQEPQREPQYVPPSPAGPAPGQEMPGAPGAGMPGVPQPGMPGAGGWVPGMPGPPAPKPGPSGLAIAGFVLSLSGFLCGITAIPGFVIGLVELGKIRSGDSPAAGRGFALTAIIVGGIIIGLMALYVLIILIAAIASI